MSPCVEVDEVDRRVRGALDEVLDPCSIGRGVPSGMVEMGLVEAVAVDRSDDGWGADVVVRLRTTGPGCSFQLYFDEQVRARIELIDGVRSVEVDWSDVFDWSDDDLHPAVKRRLKDKRDRQLARGR